MRRGRRPAKNAEEFNAMVCNRREFFGFSIAALAKMSGVNRGTLSEFFKGKRNGFGYSDRLRLIKTFDLGPDAERRFLDEEHRRIAESPLILLDPPISPHPPLDQGQRLLICAAYPEAIHEFELVYQFAGEQRDYLLQADAATRMAWVWFERGLYRDALNWVRQGIKLIETRVCATFAQIMDSVRPESPSALCPLNEEAGHVLSRLLQVRFKCYIESVLYCGGEYLRDKASETIEQSIALDRYLQVSSAIGHDLRWQAVLLISANNPQNREAERLLAESHEQFAIGSLGAAYLARDRGIVEWQKDQRRAARDSLFEAVESLSFFADSRALGPTFCVLSKVMIYSGADERVIRRCALAGAALHPYGFVLDNATRYVKDATRAGLRRDIDDLLSGAKPFEKLAPVLSRLTDGSSKALSMRLHQNLKRILGQDVDAWLRDSAVRQQS
jgi:transcriptional regulator with XRE-family HTH domain